MGEALLGVLAAVIAIIVAGLLVRRQERYSSKRKELTDEVVIGLDEAAIEFRALTGENPTETSLQGLEQDMEVLMHRLRSAEAKNHPLPYINRRRKTCQTFRKPYK